MEWVKRGALVTILDKAVPLLFCTNPSALTCCIRIDMLPDATRCHPMPPAVSLL